MSEAVNLQSVITVATQGRPMHYTGDREARTVFVMLNPGQDVEAANKDRCLKQPGSELGTCQPIGLTDVNPADIPNIIKVYHEERRHFGWIDANRPDAFDTKTVHFLKAWNGCEIDIPAGFWGSDPSKEVKLEAKMNSLQQKLQLELIPYASRKFQPNMHNIGLLRPFVETALEEIMLVTREYVIFAASIFDTLLHQYNKVAGRAFDITFGPMYYTNSSPRKRCRPIVIKDSSTGKECKAMIAHSFTLQGLNGVPMQDYGAFCHANY